MKTDWGWRQENQMWTQVWQRDKLTSLTEANCFPSSPVPNPQQGKLSLHSVLLSVCYCLPKHLSGTGYGCAQEHQKPWSPVTRWRARMQSPTPTHLWLSSSAVGHPLSSHCHIISPLVSFHTSEIYTSVFVLPIVFTAVSRQDFCLSVFLGNFYIVLSVFFFSLVLLCFVFLNSKTSQCKN